MLRQRLLIAVIGIPVLLLVLLAGAFWMSLLLIVLIVGAAIELAGLLDRAGYDVQPAVCGGLALLIGLAAALVVDGTSALFPVFLVGAVTCAAVAVAHPQPADGLRRLAGTMLTAAAAVMLSGLILIVLVVPTPPLTGPLSQWLDGGRILLLMVVLTVWAYDTAAYAIGRVFPRGHFFAHISPNKTWSGAVGGFAGAVVAGYLLGLFMGAPMAGRGPTVGLGLGILVGFVAPIGDLAESMVKRAAGVKDSSRIFPGHGGVLDRMDSFLTVAPLAWLYLVITNVGT